MKTYIKLFEEWDPEEDWEEVDPEDRLSSGVHAVQFNVENKDPDSYEPEKEAAETWSDLINGDEVKIDRVEGLMDGQGNIFRINLTNGDTILFKTFAYASIPGNDDICAIFKIGEETPYLIKFEKYVDDSADLGTDIATVMDYYKKSKETGRIFEDWDPEEDWDDPNLDDIESSGLDNLVFNVVSDDEDFDTSDYERDLAERWRGEIDGKSIRVVSVEGDINEWDTDLLIKLSNRDTIKITADFEGFPGPSNPDKIWISINGSDKIEIDPDNYFDLKEEHQSIIRAYLALYIKYRNQ